MPFQHPEDREFFVNFLAHGDEFLFEKKFKHLFDFRDPEVKRKEFNSIRGNVFQNLIKKHGKICQLNTSEKCSSTDEFNVDHYIPLKSNELNKNLRGLKRVDSKKVEAQSFGSNHPDNFILACRHCNRQKGYFLQKTKYRILMIEDDNLRDDFKIDEFNVPKGENKIELIKWKKIPKDYESRIEKLRPDLIAFNSVLTPIKWIDIVIKIKEHQKLKSIPIFVSSYLGALSTMDVWVLSGITDFLPFTKSEDLIHQYVKYLQHPKRYTPTRGMSELYFGARRQGLR